MLSSRRAAASKQGFSQIASTLPVATGCGGAALAPSCLGASFAEVCFCSLPYVLVVALVEVPVVEDIFDEKVSPPKGKVISSPGRVGLQRLVGTQAPLPTRNTAGGCVSPARQVTSPKAAASNPEQGCQAMASEKGKDAIQMSGLVCLISA